MNIAAFDDEDGIDVMIHNKERQVTLTRNMSAWIAIDENGERTSGLITNAATVNALLHWVEYGIGGKLP